jgi:hypothetical protein
LEKVEKNVIFIFIVLATFDDKFEGVVSRIESP